MDRDLTAGQRRGTWLRRGLKGGAAVIVLSGAGWTGVRLMSPSLDFSDVRVATVERGALEATISSTGTIVPRTEQTVSSPVGAEIRAVHVSPGEAVGEGQLMIELDTTASALALSKLDEQLGLKRAEIRSASLQQDDAIRQAKSRQALLGIDLESRQVKLGRLEQLADTGIVSEAELMEARLDVRRTEVELEQIAAQVVSLEERRAAELERLNLDFSILEKQRDDQARRVEMSNVRATRDGVITFLVQDEGAVVGEGQALATIASTDAFRVEASVSDFYGPQLRPRQRVRIESSTDEFSGSIGRILSIAESNRLDLYIDLDDPSAPVFHSNLNVNIEIVTAEKPDVLKVRRGPALDGAGIEQVYVIDGSYAVRRPVRLGVSERREIEVLDGLAIGDRVIISDTSEFERLARIQINR